MVESDRSAQNAKHEKAVAALLSAPTMKEAASIAGVAESTLRRWMRSDEAFRDLYSTSKRQLVEHAVGLIQQATGTAVKTLTDVMKDRTAPASARVAAARAILDHAIDASEREQIMERIDALEKALQRVGSPAGLPVGLPAG